MDIIFIKNNVTINERYEIKKNKSKIKKNELIYYLLFLFTPF